MTKLFTHTEEIEHCGECPSCECVWSVMEREWAYFCGEKKGKALPNLWGGIPSWCPLEEKE